jgi:hypothetical protein
MNPNDQRIAIALACGWKDMSWVDKGYWIKDNKTMKGLPDYLNDLNAIQQAIFTHPFGDSEEVGFSMELEKIVGEGDYYGCIVATAAQRCEAFLKTLGLWKDALKSKEGQ